MSPVFYVGLHQPSDARHFARACISINRLRLRKKPLGCSDVLIDSGAFTELAIHGRYRHEPGEYAAALRRLATVVGVTAAVAQDYMCEPFMLRRTGLTLEEHQRLTIARYDALMHEALPYPVMPVLQGYRPRDYARHVRDYGSRLGPGHWVGVGSVCKRNGVPDRIIEVLMAIKDVRPDLKLHGFGVKVTALQHAGIRDMLHSADSLAWSYSARRQGRNGNSWREAMGFSNKVEATAGEAFMPWQLPLSMIDI